MKKTGFYIASTVSALCLLITTSCSQAIDNKTASIVFVATTPCNKGATRPLSGIPASADCEMMKWKLVLYWDSIAKQPAGYHLTCSYGLPKQGTPDIVGGGRKVEMKGKWSIASNIYVLNPDKPKEMVCFMKMSDDLIHLLDSEKQFMIGNGGWSYSLNRLMN